MVSPVDEMVELIDDVPEISEALFELFKLVCIRLSVLFRLLLDE